ncbi:unnamed protein product [Amoebophrya sp. A120]|nr:unnamed protein product [Amoebophrya sp. A120]|eukprot:GSA120T00025889001.1
MQAQSRAWTALGEVECTDGVRYATINGVPYEDLSTIDMEQYEWGKSVSAPTTGGVRYDPPTTWNPYLENDLFYHIRRQGPGTDPGDDGWLHPFHDIPARGEFRTNPPSAFADTVETGFDDAFKTLRIRRLAEMLRRIQLWESWKRRLADLLWKCRKQRMALAGSTYNNETQEHEHGDDLREDVPLCRYPLVALLLRRLQTSAVQENLSALEALIGFAFACAELQMVDEFECEKALRTLSARGYMSAEESAKWEQQREALQLQRLQDLSEIYDELPPILHGAARGTTLERQED